MSVKDPALDSRVAASDPIYLHLRERIVDGRLLGGERLKEADIAARAGVSRTPVRRALQLLERDALVRLLPNRGAIVIGWTSQDCEEIFDLRAVLEGYCASRAAQRIDDRILAALEASLQAQRHAMTLDGEARVDRLVDLNVAFHSLIADACGNQRLKHIAATAFHVPQPIRRRLWASPEHCASALLCHREIVEALRLRDSVHADAAMRTHIYSAKYFFIKLYKDHAEEHGDSEESICP